MGKHLELYKTSSSEEPNLLTSMNPILL